MKRKRREEIARKIKSGRQNWGVPSRLRCFSVRLCECEGTAGPYYRMGK